MYTYTRRTVCTHICVYPYMYVYAHKHNIHIYTNARLSMLILALTHINVYVCGYAPMCAYTCMRSYISVRTYTYKCIYVCACICIYMYVYTCGICVDIQIYSEKERCDGPLSCRLRLAPGLAWRLGFCPLALAAPSCLC